MGRRITAAVTAGLVGAGALYAVLDAVDVVPGPLTSDWSVGSTAETQPSLVAAPPVAALDPQAPLPHPNRLAAHVRGVLTDPVLGTRPALMVSDAATGTPLLTFAVDVPRTPASTVKVLTAAAVAAETDLSARRTTRVTAGTEPGVIVLVADGDTLLARGAGNPYAVAGHAGLADLAEDVAAALAGNAGGRKATGAAPADGYRLVLDDAIAAGPPTAPEWAPADLAGGFTAPVAMLGLAEDRAVPGRPATSDPAMTAALAFRDALRQAGVPVADEVVRSRGAGVGAELASAPGPTVGETLSLALDESDNALTESVARRAFVDKGVPPQFAAAGAHLSEVLQRLGVDVTGLSLADASGLSRSSRATARTVNETTALAASPERSPGGGAFTEVIARLPVAALDGTLFDRFAAAETLPGQGVVRAKTGTLTGVGALTGTLVDNAGRLLVFTVVADQAPYGAARETRAALDRVATALVTCDCAAPTSPAPPGEAATPGQPAEDAGDALFRRLNDTAFGTP